MGWAEFFFFFKKSDVTNGWLCWEGNKKEKKKKEREERLVEERISKITQRTKQGGKTRDAAPEKRKPEEAEGRGEKIEARKKGQSGYGSLPLEIILYVRAGWWLFADTLRAEIVGGRERPAQLSGVDWPV